MPNVGSRPSLPIARSRKFGTTSQDLGHEHVTKMDDLMIPALKMLFGLGLSQAWGGTPKFSSCDNENHGLNYHDIIWASQNLMHTTITAI